MFAESLIRTDALRNIAAGDGVCRGHLAPLRARRGSELSSSLVGWVPLIVLASVPKLRTSQLGYRTCRARIQRWGAYAGTAQAEWVLVPQQRCTSSPQATGVPAGAHPTHLALRVSSAMSADGAPS